MSRPHLIGRQHFRIKINHQEAAEPLFDRLSDLSKNRLTRLLDELFTDLVPEGETLRIDQLVVDVGELSGDRLEEEITERLMEGLRREIGGQRRLSPGPSVTTAEGRREAHRGDEAGGRDEEEERHSRTELAPDLLGALRSFLVTGSYPWWMTHGRAPSPSELLLQLVRKYPIKLRELLRREAGNTNSFGRLRRQFSVEALAAVTATYIAEQWAGWRTDIDLLVGAYRSDPFAQGGKPDGVERSLLAVTLRHATKREERSKVKNSKEKTIDARTNVLLAGLAGVYRVPISGLRTHFLQTLSTARQAATSLVQRERIDRLIRQLAEKEQVTEGASGAGESVSTRAPEAAKESERPGEKNLLRVILHYLRTGAVPANGALRSGEAIERQLVTLLVGDARHLVRALRTVLADPAIRTRAHAALAWPTLLAVHRRLWGSSWPLVANYLADLGLLVEELALPAFTLNYLRRRHLAEWLALLMKGGARRNEAAASGNAFWADCLQRALRQLQRESGQPVSGKNRTVGKRRGLEDDRWKTDLPDRLDEALSGAEFPVFDEVLPVKSVEVYRYFLENGHLPASYAQRDAAELNEDIYQRVRHGDSALLEMLAIVLQQPAAYERFRREAELRLLEELARRLTKAPEKEGDEATSPALQPTPNPRPRPKNDLPATPWNLLLLFLNAPSAHAPWWADDRPAYLRYANAFVVRQQLISSVTDATSPTLLQLWAEEIGRLTGQALPAVIAAFTSSAESRNYPPALSAALQNLARSTTTESGPNPPTGTQNKQSETPTAEPENDVLTYWCERLAGKPDDFVTKQQQPIFAPFLTPDPSYRSSLRKRLADRQLFPGRFRKLVTPSEWRLFLQRLTADLGEPTESLLTALRSGTIKAKIYTSAAAAERFENYQFLSLLGSQSAPERPAENLLALIAREHQMTTPALAGQLLDTAGLPANDSLRILLERVAARLPEATVEKLQKGIREAQKKASGLSAGERDGPFYRAALIAHLRQGQSPWWEEENYRIDELFSRSAKQDAGAVAQLLAGQPALAERLLPFLPEPVLRSFITKIHGAYADFLLVWIEQLRTIGQDKTGHFADATTRRFVWEYTLRQQAFDSRSFVREALNSAARARAISGRKMLAALIESVAVKVALNDVRYYRLAAVLQELKEEGAAAGAKQVPVEKRGKETAPAPTVRPEAPIASTTNYADALEAELTHLHHFLLYGTPPSGTSSLSRSGLLKIQERLLRNHPTVAAALYRTILADRPARNRFLRFSPVALYDKVLRLLVGSELTKAKRLWADLAELLPGILRRFVPAVFRQTAAEELLAYPAVWQKKPNFKDYPEYLLEQIARREGKPLPTLFAELVTATEKRTEPLKEDWSRILGDIREKKIKEATSGTDEAAITNPPVMDEPLYIHNSGLVILAPYLPRYFDMLGMLDGKVFPDEATAARAALLLEYLASGRAEVPEYELAFNKVLCGLQIDTPLPASIELTDEETEISRQILNAILQNWDKMSGSTVENLQGSFLLRAGLLRQGEDAWSLNVESAGFDVLLSFIPWTISLVSLPWMERRLEVDWKTSVS